MVPGTDLVIVRENTEGFYADRNTHAGTGELMPTPDVAIAMGIITRPGCERIARSAFELARRRDKRVTIVHKANVLRLTTGLFRDVCREVAADYPDVTVDDFHIDAMTVHLVRNADRFDVIVTENMFGDILSDLAGEIAGVAGHRALDQLLGHPRHGPGGARVGTRHRRAGHRPPDRHDPLQRDAARLARRQARRPAPDRRRRPRRARRRRCGGRRNQHPRPRRSASTTEFTGAVVAAVRTA